MKSTNELFAALAAAAQTENGIDLPQPTPGDTTYRSALETYESMRSNPDAIIPNWAGIAILKKALNV